MKRICQALVAIAALGTAGLASAHGYGRVAIGYSWPVAAPVYAPPPPVYYVPPRVVYVVPAPVYYQPAPVYYQQPVTVYRPAPVAVVPSERRAAVRAPAQPAPAAPPMAVKPYRN